MATFFFNLNNFNMAAITLREKLPFHIALNSQQFLLIRARKKRAEKCERGREEKLIETSTGSRLAEALVNKLKINTPI
jgi:hypothetical protein